MEFIYIRGGDKTAPEIAERAGMHYGARHDYTTYSEVYMLDIKWKNYRWQDVLKKTIEYNCKIAMVADYERKEQRKTMLSQIADLREYTKAKIYVCPKFHGAIDDIPNDCVIAISVPAKTYAGFIPDYRKLNGRKIHLLGGRPEKQCEIMIKAQGAGGEIVSMDGSYHAMKAAKGQMYTQGKWLKARGTTKELTIQSAKNIIVYLNNAKKFKQQALFN